MNKLKHRKFCEICESRKRGSDSKRWDCGPLAVLKLETGSSIVRVPEEFEKFLIPGKTSSKSPWKEIDVAVCVHGKEMVEYLNFLLRWLSVFQLVGDPITVEDEVKCMAVHTFWNTSFYTSQLFDGYRERPMGTREKGNKEIVPSNRVEISHVPLQYLGSIK